jgi:hypothetical protein
MELIATDAGNMVIPSTLSLSDHSSLDQWQAADTPGLYQIHVNPNSTSVASSYCAIKLRVQSTLNIFIAFTQGDMHSDQSMLYPIAGCLLVLITQ